MLSEAVVRALLEFRHRRNWEQFHRPKELASALTIEASELQEVFQWKTDEEVKTLLSSSSREKVLDEVADVAIVLSYLCHDLNIDLNAAVLSKLQKNEVKYPLTKSYDTSKKYDEL